MSMSSQNTVQVDREEYDSRQQRLYQIFAGILPELVEMGEGSTDSRDAEQQGVPQEIIDRDCRVISFSEAMVQESHRLQARIPTGSTSEPETQEKEQPCANEGCTLNKLRHPENVMGPSACDGFSSKSTIGQEDDKVCEVCQCGYEDADEVMVLPCHHFYHVSCIRRWLGMRTTCPKCRFEVSTPPPQREWVITTTTTIEWTPITQWVPGSTTTVEVRQEVGSEVETVTTTTVRPTGFQVQQHPGAPPPLIGHMPSGYVSVPDDDIGTTSRENGWRGVEEEVTPAADPRQTASEPSLLNLPFTTSTGEVESAAPTAAVATHDDSRAGEELLAAGAPDSDASLEGLVQSGSAADWNGAGRGQAWSPVVVTRVPLQRDRLDEGSTPSDVQHVPPAVPVAFQTHTSRVTRPITTPEQQLRGAVAAAASGSSPTSTSRPATAAGPSSLAAGRLRTSSAPLPTMGQSPPTTAMARVPSASPSVTVTTSPSLRPAPRAGQAQDLTSSLDTAQSVRREQAPRPAPTVLQPRTTLPHQVVVQPGSSPPAFSSSAASRQPTHAGTAPFVASSAEGSARVRIVEHRRQTHQPALVGSRAVQMATLPPRPATSTNGMASSQQRPVTRMRPATGQMPTQPAPSMPVTTSYSPQAPRPPSGSWQAMMGSSGQQIFAPSPPVGPTSRMTASSLGPPSPTIQPQTRGPPSPQTPPLRPGGPMPWHAPPPVERRVAGPVIHVHHQHAFWR